MCGAGAVGARHAPPSPLRKARVQTLHERGHHAHTRHTHNTQRTNACHNAIHTTTDGPATRNVHATGWPTPGTLPTDGAMATATVGGADMVPLVAVAGWPFFLSAHRQKSCVSNPTAEHTRGLIPTHSPRSPPSTRNMRQPCCVGAGASLTQSRGVAQCGDTMPPVRTASHHAHSILTQKSVQIRLKSRKVATKYAQAAQREEVWRR